MKSNKGISMITLIITIICMIIFLGIAFSVGSRYIFESKEEERTALVSILSTSVERRQNDKYVGNSEQLYYIGYRIVEDDFNKLFEKFTDKNCMYAPGLWYALDAQKAEDLGIVDSEKYLINDLNDEYDDDTKKYLAVVDYYTGKVELLKREDVNDIIGGITDKDDGTGCDHKFTVVSCIEPSVCEKCGTIAAQPLGHDYNYSEPTCTEDMKCNRCGYIFAKAIGHEYDLSTLSHNDEGHFNKCIRYDQCFGVGNFEKHEKVYLQDESGTLWVHDIVCNVTGCTWQKSDEACTIQIRPKDTYHHIKYCTLCLKEEEVEHDKLKYKHIDENEHMVWCESCNSDLYREEHIDVNLPYGECDKCGGDTNTALIPRINLLTMENISQSGDYAKKGDIIKITMQVSVLLADDPDIYLKGEYLNDKEEFERDELTYTILVDTNKYSFSDGRMDIEVRNIKSLWNIAGDNVYSTTDNSELTYDATKPEYIYVPEN